MTNMIRFVGKNQPNPPVTTMNPTVLPKIISMPSDSKVVFDDCPLAEVVDSMKTACTDAPRNHYVSIAGDGVIVVKRLHNLIDGNRAMELDTLEEWETRYYLNARVNGPRYQYIRRYARDNDLNLKCQYNTHLGALAVTRYPAGHATSIVERARTMNIYEQVSGTNLPDNSQKLRTIRQFMRDLPLLLLVLHDRASRSATITKLDPLNLGDWSRYVQHTRPQHRYDPITRLKAPFTVRTRTLDHIEFDFMTGDGVYRGRTVRVLGHDKQTGEYDVEVVA